MAADEASKTFSEDDHIRRAETFLRTERGAYDGAGPEIPVPMVTKLWAA